MHRPAPLEIHRHLDLARPAHHPLQLRPRQSNVVSIQHVEDEALKDPTQGIGMRRQRTDPSSNERHGSKRRNPQNAGVHKKNRAIKRRWLWRRTVASCALNLSTQPSYLEAWNGRK